jgi:sodium-dependent phosphate cotransporter
VLEHPLTRLLLILVLVYLFILAISLMGAAFKLAGKGFAETLFSATANPIAGLIIGILVTSIVQSSSTTTSLIVGLVGSGVLPFQAAIPMVMGANIGTTITNTIVSLGSVGRRDEFRRAFSGATVHDFFNICSVIVLLPLQIRFNLIGASAELVESWFEGFGGARFSSPLAAITKPVAKGIVFLTGDSALLSAVLAFVLLFLALRYIVKVLRSLVLSRVERFFQRYIFRTPLLGFALGICLTVMVQSSSITTSLVVPLLGAGVITLHQVFPYMLGANIGTTITAFLASFVTGSPEAVSVAFAHLFFNLYGTAIFWPLKRIPIYFGEKLAALTMKSRLVPFMFIVLVFFAIPGILLFIMG